MWGRSRPSRARALTATLIAAALIAALIAGPAQGGATTAAKRATKAKIVAAKMTPVTIKCRLDGKNGSRGVKCSWAAAKQQAAETKLCRGYSTQPPGKSLSFVLEKCKTDPAATSLTALLPQKLGNAGYESTSSFCWSTLTGSFRCSWTARKYLVVSTQGCRGGAAVLNGNMTLNGVSCLTDTALTGAQTSVRTQLGGQGLRPASVQCRPSGTASACAWTANWASAGWTYTCSGNVTVGGAPIGRLPCDLDAPREAPLMANPAPHFDVFGVSEVWTQFGNGELPALDALGATAVRFPLSWGAVERQRGSYDWSQYAPAYDRAVGAGMTPVIIITGSPCWANSISNCDPFDPELSNRAPSPSFTAAWGEFAAATAERFPEAVIEVWNEPNLREFYTPAPDADRYAELLDAAYESIKAGSPDTTVISGGLSPSYSTGADQIEFETFLRRFLAEGGASHADGIGFHAYTGRAVSDDYLRALRFEMADLKDAMVDHDAQDLPIWITETGASTTGDAPYTEAEQAAFLSDGYRQFRRIPGIAAVLVHRWRDSNVSVKESGFGLTRANGGKKPAFCQLADARGMDRPPGC